MCIYNIFSQVKKRRGRPPGSGKKQAENLKQKQEEEEKIEKDTESFTKPTEGDMGQKSKTASPLGNGHGGT